MLTIGRKILNRILPFIQTSSVGRRCVGVSDWACVSLPRPSLTVSDSCHSCAFIMGIALGDSVHLHERVREIIHQFATNIFALIYGNVSGLHVNFIEHFDLSLIAIVPDLLCVGKIVGDLQEPMPADSIYVKQLLLEWEWMREERWKLFWELWHSRAGIIQHGGIICHSRSDGIGNQFS